MAKMQKNSELHESFSPFVAKESKELVGMAEEIQ